MAACVPAGLISRGTRYPLLDPPCVAGEAEVLATLESVSDGGTLVGSTGESVESVVPGSSSGVTVDEEAGATGPGRDAGTAVDADRGSMAADASSTEAAEATLMGSKDAAAKSAPSGTSLATVGGPAVTKDPASVLSGSGCSSSGGAGVPEAGTTCVKKERKRKCRKTGSILNLPKWPP